MPDPTSFSDSLAAAEAERLPEEIASYRDKITITFERRADGGLRVYSDELPGLALSHADHAAVLADVRPAIEGLLFHRLTAAETERDALRARAERAEKALEGWKRVAVVAALPLEAMRMAGSYRTLSPSTQACVDEAVVTIRMAIAGHGLPPEGDMDAAVAPALSALAYPVPVEEEKP